MPLRVPFALLIVLPRIAHADAPSALRPAGDNAVRIAEIAWVLFAGGAAIFVAVMALALVALFGPPALRAALGRRSVIVGGGIAFPVIVLTALLVYTFTAASAMVRDDKAPAARIEVAGELWWWRVRYLDDAGKTIAETANEIRIPVGQPVEFLLVSDNLVHSFWVPGLAGKIDMLPGRVNRLRVQAHAPGIFRGQCAEYCGAQHAKMAFHVVAQAADEYGAWLAAQAQPAPMPQDARLQHGMRLFLQNGCAACHTVRGTQAAGRLGPDLTHLGSRHAIAAGQLPNNAATIAGWIVGGQQLKPENRMPAFHQFSGAELGALAAYLESLR